MGRFEVRFTQIKKTGLTCKSHGRNRVCDGFCVVHDKAITTSSNDSHFVGSNYLTNTHCAQECGWEYCQALVPRAIRGYRLQTRSSQRGGRILRVAGTICSLFAGHRNSVERLFGTIFWCVFSIVHICFFLVSPYSDFRLRAYFLTTTLCQHSV